VHWHSSLCIPTSGMLRAEPSLLPNAINEVLRHESP
jgi:hypothetical protein